MCLKERFIFLYIETVMNKEFLGPASMVRMEVYKTKERLTLSKKKRHVFFHSSLLCKTDQSCNNLGLFVSFEFTWKYGNSSIMLPQGP